MTIVGDVELGLGEAVCVWAERFEPDYWGTTCGNEFHFPDGTPTGNTFRFCPYCGNKILEIPYPEEEGDRLNE